MVFEKEEGFGYGMPYHPRQTDIHNLCNIASKEIPELTQTFAEWLSELDDSTLITLGIRGSEICEDEVYSRIALGSYFAGQWRTIVNKLRQHGVEMIERAETAVCDIVDRRKDSTINVIVDRGDCIEFDHVVIATGHFFDASVDDPANGYYGSPWPVHKLLPSQEERYCFDIGILGASLSAFDVVSSLSHRHGEFERAGDVLRFHLYPEAVGFRLVMHSSQGWLPHLQYEQREAYREIYRHVSRQQILDLIDADGFLKLDRYFNQICRLVLIRAFRHDNREDVACKILNQSFSLEDFIELMSEEHSFDDPFEGMRREFPEARASLESGRPIHWKEVLDDLMYTLNFHAELLSAEDHMRLRTTVMPFLMSVIAALPLQSARVLLALRDAGVLDLVRGQAEVLERANGLTTVQVACAHATTERTFRMFVDCSGQSGIGIENHPFPSLVRSGSIRAARVRFADSVSQEALGLGHGARVLSGDPPSLQLDGIDIDNEYHVIDTLGNPNPRIQVIAFPLTTGHRPYSYGLQACSDTAALLVEAWEKKGSRRKTKGYSLDSTLGNQASTGVIVDAFDVDLIGRQLEEND